LGDSELAAIVDAVSDATLVRDGHGHLLRANQAAVELLGFGSLSELLGTSMNGLLERIDIRDAAGSPVPLADLPGSIALRGGDPAEQVLQIRRRGTSEVRWALVRARGVRDDTGAVACAVLSFSDPAPHRRPERRERFLARATATLSESLEYETTLRRAAQLAVPDLADWCVVDSAEPGGRIRRIAVAHADADQRDHAWVLTRRHPIRPDNRIGPPAVIRSGRSALWERVADHDLRAFASDQQHLESLRALGLRSVMIVPLRTRGRTHGALTFALTRGGSRYARADLALAEELASRCALAADNARLYGHQRSVARTLQDGLVPPIPPRVEGLEAAAVYRPADPALVASGDFYDLFEAQGGWLAVVGDVSGNGAGAAVVTGLLRHSLRAHAVHEPRPAWLLDHLNRALLEAAVDELATLICARLERRGARFDATLVSAGHPPPLVRRADGDVETIALPGTILGAVEEPLFAERKVELGPGDLLLLYTDGLIEARGPDGMLGERAVAERMSATARPREAVEALEALALDTQAGVPLHNDIALLALRVGPAGPAIS
jgi:serine phosphatase RsbU (regulator of sigma subunit)/PAS domain-containing protein